MRNLINIINEQFETYSLEQYREKLNLLISDPETYQESIDRFGVLDDLWITSRGGLMIFRALDLQQPWEQHLRLTHHPYWAVTQRGAGIYCSDHRPGNVEVCISGEYFPPCWESVCDNIMHYHHIGEDEIRLGDGDRIKIIEINIQGRVAESQLVGQFLAA